MNKAFLIGNLVRDPELRSTTTGKSVCSFTIAVNRRKTQNNQNPEADYFRVTAWGELGESCSKYLAKGRKVAVTGSVSLSTYNTQEGQTRSNIEVRADEVEFLTPREHTEAAQNTQTSVQTGFVKVETDDLPF